MLASLNIRNFVLIEDATLEFSPGLNVLTGETGAGKTLLTRALGLLVGERAEEGLIGQAGDEACIQALFEPRTEIPEVSGDLATLVAADPSQIIVTRRLSKSGKNRCYVNDTAVTLNSMGELSRALLSFAGQHEYRRLLDPGYQLAVLDRWAGEDVIRLASEFKGAYEDAMQTIRRLEIAHLSDQSRLHEIEQLRFEVSELSEARLSSDEEKRLQTEQKVLARAEDILRNAGITADLLGGCDDRSDAVSLVAQASAQLAGLHGVDEFVDEVAHTLDGLQYQIRELSRELRRYLDHITVDPSRLASIDHRLRLYTDLARKYGGTTETALAHLEVSVKRLAMLEKTEEDLVQLEKTRAASVTHALELATALSSRRSQAAPALEKAVGAQLRDLGIVEAGFHVALQSRDGWEGLRESGADIVEFLLAANPGQQPRSLARTASGGELSRVLLALKCALADAGGDETLVFDEIDAGIGGRTAVAVGSKLRELAANSQLILVTHLAQVAALGERHYRIEKVSVGGTTVTRLTLISGEYIVEELCRMMGGRSENAEAMAHARELRDSAAIG